MNSIQKQIFHLLETFDEFCKAEELQYCLFWGTLLGCVRHRGFIPWDDDIDLAMPRESFERLIAIAQDNRLPPNLCFENAYDLKGCRVPKIRDKSVCISDKNNGEGIFIDIFPLDFYSELDVSILKLARYGLWLRDRRKKISNKHARMLYTIVSALPYAFFSGTKKMYSNFSSHKKDGEWVSNSVLTNCEYFFPKNTFYPFKEAQFEGKKFPIPQDEVAILTIRYGNFMTPINECNSHYKGAEI